MTVRVAKDGIRHPLSVTLTPLWDRHGLFAGASETSRDLTELQAALAMAESARKSAESANAAKDHLLGMLSHELRTPLTPVLASITQIEAIPDLPDGLRQEIRVMRRNVEMEVHLVDDLLDLTLIRREGVRLHYELVDAHHSLRTVLASVKNETDSKGLRATTNLLAEHHHVWADPRRLQQIFLSLMSNAVKFTPFGGDIAIHTSNDEAGRLRIQFVDTGIGIQSDVMPRLFTEFEQGEKMQTRLYGGLGLGLSLAKSLVEMQKGTLTVASGGRGKGATFNVEFDPVPQTPKASDDFPVRLKKCRVLLVEDHDDTRHVLGRILNGFGCLVAAAASVREALELADREQFDLLVSDIGLPDGSGTEIIRHVKSRYPIKGIALSGFGQDEDMRRSIDAGFEMHLTKPVNFQTLQRVIEQVAS